MFHDLQQGDLVITVPMCVHPEDGFLGVRVKGVIGGD